MKKIIFMFSLCICAIGLVGCASNNSNEVETTKVELPKSWDELAELHDDADDYVPRAIDIYGEDGERKVDTNGDRLQPLDADQYTGELEDGGEEESGTTVENESETTIENKVSSESESETTVVEVADSPDNLKCDTVLLEDKYTYKLLGIENYYTDKDKVMVLESNDPNEIIISSIVINDAYIERDDVFGCVIDLQDSKYLNSIHSDTGNKIAFKINNSDYIEVQIDKDGNVSVIDKESLQVVAGTDTGIYLAKTLD